MVSSYSYEPDSSGFTNADGYGPVPQALPFFPAVPQTGRDNLNPMLNLPSSEAYDGQYYDDMSAGRCPTRQGVVNNTLMPGGGSQSLEAGGEITPGLIINNNNQQFQPFMDGQHR
jgi:hypothetical protein